MAITSLDGFSGFDAVQLFGVDRKVGTPTSVEVLEIDSSSNVLFARGTTVPTDTDAGFAVGCVFIKTNGSAGTVFYVNEGTASSCDFNVTVAGVITRTDMSAPAASKSLTASAAQVATTGTTSLSYIVVPETGTVSSATFVGEDALAANDSNYVTFTITNLGVNGAGSTAVLAATAANTSQATGGSAISAKTPRALTLNGTASNLDVTAGQVLEVSIAATGTLAGAIDRPAVMVKFAGTT